MPPARSTTTAHPSRANQPQPRHALVPTPPPARAPTPALSACIGEGRGRRPERLRAVVRRRRWDAGRRRWRTCCSSSSLSLPTPAQTTSPASCSQQPAPAHYSKISSPHPLSPRLLALADACRRAQRQPAERAHPAQHAPAHFTRGAPNLGMCCRDTPGGEAEGGTGVGGGGCQKAVGEGEYWSGGGGGACRAWG